MSDSEKQHIAYLKCKDSMWFFRHKSTDNSTKISSSSFQQLLKAQIQLDWENIAPLL